MKGIKDIGIIDTRSRNVRLNWETYEELRKFKQKNNIATFEDAVALLIIRVNRRRKR